VKILQTKTNKPFQLIIYGPSIESIDKTIHQNNLGHLIDYRGEVPQPILAEEVKKCHSLILYSRFETFGCVVIEALASGLPVIASDIPVMRELITKDTNGLFAPIENAGALAGKMLEMMEHYHMFNTQQIAADSADNYSYNKVGKMFDDLFKKFSSPKQVRSRPE
jgi:glycosyltransferase involved in cell wall biosynthesis